jgi:hypothetical protein
MGEDTLIMGEMEKRLAQRLSQGAARPPTRVPGFDNEEFLGKGAFGEVWLAQDRNTGRRVAIKFYSHRGGLDWSLLSREVEKLRFLFNDRHVVQLLEVGWESDPPYYVMEYLEQGSLEDRLKQGPLPAREAVSLIRDVAVGLIHAHGRGILHCDLKPANILLDQDGKPRLADFGQSRLTNEQAPALGTLFYMAPEQADLNAAPDARWDVYALGAVFYQLLTGQPPYREGHNATEVLRADSLEERLERYRKLIQETSRPRGHREVAGVNRTLADILDKCLAPQARDRYPNVQAVLNALDSWSLKRARRPLLVLGAVGPLLILLVMAGFAMRGLAMTVDDSKDALVHRALEANFFAARFVAEQFSLDIDKRWRILQQEAADPELRQNLDAIASTEPGSAAYEKRQREIEAWVQQRFAQYRKQFKPGTEAASWIVNDRRGIQVGRSPYDAKTINKNWKARDYFHGRGLHPGSGPLVPIRAPHRSVVFRSHATRSLMVAFSVPVWGQTAEQNMSIGVLAMTVELGSFLELAAESQNQFAVLIDTRPDAEKQKPGLVIEHPFLDEQRKNKKGAPAIYVNEDVLRRADDLQRTRTAELTSLFQRRLLKGSLDQDFVLPHRDQQDVTNYRDPVPGYESESWLGTMEPVIMVRGPESFWDTGWVVLVQKRYQAVVDPVNALQSRLALLGLWALAIIALVLTVLWGFVIFVLNETPGSRFIATLRRWRGLPASGWSGGSAASSSTSAMAPTVIVPQKEDQNKG